MSPDPVSRETSSTAVVRQRGRMLVQIDRRPSMLTGYSPTRRPNLFHPQTRRFFDHDCTIYFINAPRARGDDYFATPFWDGDRISSEPMAPAASPSFDEQADFILGARPDARLIVRFGPYEPANWRALHAEELFVTEAGERRPCPSLASERYWRDGARFIEAVIRHCESRPWAHRIAGYWTGQRVEGTHQPAIEGWVVDHSAPMRRRWTRFLREKYGSDAAWRSAWGAAAEGASLEAPPLPPEPFRRDAPSVQQSLYWQAGVENAPLRDYFELTALLYAEGTRLQTAVHRAAAPPDRFFLLDALKQPMQGWNNLGFFDEKLSWPRFYIDMQAGSGSIGVSDLIDDPGLDGLVTPHDYQARGVGGVYLPEGPADSCVLRGKLFLCEMDTRAWTGVDGNVFGSARDAEEFAAITWRNVADTLTRGYHSYYMDVFTDWFADDAVQRIIGRQVEVMNAAAEVPHEDVPGIAVVLDDRCVYDTNGDGAYLNEAVMWEMKQGLARCGVPYRLYLMEDLALENFPAHRAFYFPNLFRLDDRTLELLSRRVLRGGNVVLWGPGSGISDGKTVAAEHASRLTGLAFDLIRANHPRRTLLCDFDHPITAGCDEGQVIGGPLAYGPVLLPTDGRVLGWAWTKQGRVTAGLAVKEIGEGDARWTSVFTTAVPLPADLWRGLARASGTHVYSGHNDVLLASRRYLGVHTVRRGRKTLSLPEPCRVTDLITGERVADRADRFEFDTAAPTTRLYRLDPLVDASPLA